MSAYACEGGLDGRYQPATCYRPALALGRRRGPGTAEGLWENYEVVLDLAGDLQLAGVSLEVSWARLEPRRGYRDEAAVSRYAEVIAHARDRGLFVNVAAIDAAWPAWLGQEAWLMPWVVPVATDYVNWLTSSLSADSWSVFAARGSLTQGFLDEGAGPPWRRGAREDARSASRNLDEIARAVAGDDGVAFVTSAAVELDEVSSAPVAGVDEVHVKSLVRGVGPLASARGIVARRGDRWVPVGRDLAPVLRRA
ncbi:MAG: hypothetical protein HIU57_05745 [Acidobacteria bacterium]|nr:hypothetical protein [Acidobacteriota bacterium]